MDSGRWWNRTCNLASSPRTPGYPNRGDTGSAQLAARDLLIGRTMEWDFEAEVWLWKSDGAWHFVSVPEAVADEIEDMPINWGGFGSVRVEVTIGSSTWRTSLFPSKDIRSFVLP